jgi:hypothetical protein
MRMIAQLGNAHQTVPIDKIGNGAMIAALTAFDVRDSVQMFWIVRCLGAHTNSSARIPLGGLRRLNLAHGSATEMRVSEPKTMRPHFTRRRAGRQPLTTRTTKGQSKRSPEAIRGGGRCAGGGSRRAAYGHISITARGGGRGLKVWEGTSARRSKVRGAAHSLASLR